MRTNDHMNVAAHPDNYRDTIGAYLGAFVFLTIADAVKENIFVFSSNKHIKSVDNRNVTKYSAP